MNLSRVLLFILSLGVGMPIGAVQNKKIYGERPTKGKELAAGNARKRLNELLGDFNRGTIGILESQAETLPEEEFNALVAEAEELIKNYWPSDPPKGFLGKLNKCKFTRLAAQRTNPQPAPTEPVPTEPTKPPVPTEPTPNEPNPNPQPVPEGGILDTLKQYTTSIAAAIGAAVTTGVIYNLLDRDNTVPVVPNPPVPAPNIPTVPTPTTPNVPTPIDIPVVVTPPQITVPTPPATPERPGTGEEPTPIDITSPDSPIIPIVTTPTTPEPAEPQVPQRRMFRLFGSDDQDNPVVVEREIALLSPTINGDIDENIDEMNFHNITRDELNTIFTALQQLKDEAGEGEDLPNLLQHGHANPANLARWRHLFNGVPANQRLRLAQGTQALDLPFFTYLLRPRIRFTYECKDRTKRIELDTLLALRIPRLRQLLIGEGQGALALGQDNIPLDISLKDSNAQPVEDIITRFGRFCTQVQEQNQSLDAAILNTPENIRQWPLLFVDITDPVQRNLYRQVAEYLGLPLFTAILAPLPVHQRHPRLEALLRAMKKYRGDVERNLAQTRPLLERREVTHIPRNGTRTARQQQAINAACQAVVDFKEATFDDTYADLCAKIEAVYNIMGRVSRGELAGQKGIVGEIHQEARRLLRLLTNQANSVMQTLTNFIGQPGINADLERFGVREAMHDMSKKMKVLNGLLLSQSFEEFLTPQEKAQFARCLNQMSELIRYQR